MEEERKWDEGQKGGEELSVRSSGWSPDEENEGTPADRQAAPFPRYMNETSLDLPSSQSAVI